MKSITKKDLPNAVKNFYNPKVKKNILLLIITFIAMIGGIVISETAHLVIFAVGTAFVIFVGFHFIMNINEKDDWLRLASSEGKSAFLTEAKSFSDVISQYPQMKKTRFARK